MNFTADCSPVDDVDDDVCGGEDNPGHAVYSAHGVQSFLGVADGSGHAPGQWTRDTGHLTQFLPFTRALLWTLFHVLITKLGLKFSVNVS